MTMARSSESMESRPSPSEKSGASASMSGGVTSSSIRDSMMSRLISNSRSSCRDMHEPPLVELAHLRRQPARRDSLGDPLADLDRPQRPVHLHRELHGAIGRSEEHTSELQSLTNVVCRLLLEKKKRKAFQLSPVPSRDGGA